jgi:hypothetical protein
LAGASGICSGVVAPIASDVEPAGAFTGVIASSDSENEFR